MIDNVEYPVEKYVEPADWAGSSLQERLVTAIVLMANSYIS